MPRGTKGQRIYRSQANADLCKPVAVSDEPGNAARDGAPQGDNRNCGSNHDLAQITATAGNGQYLG